MYILIQLPSQSKLNPLKSNPITINALQHHSISYQMTEVPSLLSLKSTIKIYLK